MMPIAMLCGFVTSCLVNWWLIHAGLWGEDVHALRLHAALIAEIDRSRAGHSNAIRLPKPDRPRDVQGRNNRKGSAFLQHTMTILRSYSLQPSTMDIIAACAGCTAVCTGHVEQDEFASPGHLAALLR